jgi:pimeloyl-ACP methyl ester carboxylesterase
MTVIVVVGLVAVVLMGLLLAVPWLVRRRDERRAGPPIGLAEAIVGVRETVVTTDDGAELHVAEWGRGTPIVLVHGLALDHRTWHNQCVELADRYRLVGVDLRGHGRSTLGREPIGPHRSAADLAAVFEQLDLRDAVLVGHSLGGTVVGQLCADRPDLVHARVAGLVFVGTFASAVAGEGRFRERCSPTLVRAAARFQTRAEPRGEPSSSPMTYLVARSPFGPRPQPEQVRFTLDMGAACAPSVVGAASVANLAYDVRADLRRIQRPALVIRGEHDTLATARSAEQLEAALPDVEVVVIAGSGHLPMLERPEAFTRSLIEFVTRVTEQPRTER